MKEFLRGMAITGIVIENFLSMVRINISSAEVEAVVEYIKYFGASLVHVFFFLSGYGLTKKLIDYVEFPWKLYAIDRISMIALPYWITVTASFAFVNVLHFLDPAVFTESYKASDLLSYIVFFRNFDISSWGMNPTLWFMQVIFGLYVVFPFLLTLMKRYGFKSLLLVSITLTYSSRYLFLVNGWKIHREAGFFMFYLLEFVIGMLAAAHVHHILKVKDSRYLSAGLFVVGVVGYIVSYVLKIMVGTAANLHDIFTYFGSLGLGLWSHRVVAALRWWKVESVFSTMGKAAFVIYLVHAPPIKFLIKPLLLRYNENAPGIGEVFVSMVLYLCILFWAARRLSAYLMSFSLAIKGRLGTYFTP